jgi:1-acyl-sn-glycerol-3-phosphate acyltransferase
MDTNRHEWEQTRISPLATDGFRGNPYRFFTLSDSCSFVSIRGFSLRSVVGLLWLAGEVILALMKFVALVTAHAGTPDRMTRARWLQSVCQRALRVFHIELRVIGPIPTSGLLVCNHLSYLDILILGATTPCVFVSKCEVRRWPVFGWFASLAGTLFLRRDRRSDVARMSRDMRRLLDTGALVVLFPEGTTSDGSTVLPFKSSLLEPATRQPHGLSAGFIEYALTDGGVAEEVCYWRDMTLAPHLLNLLGKRGLEARLRFTRLRQPSQDRKQLARQLHSEVVRLKEESNFSNHE